MNSKNSFTTWFQGISGGNRFYIIIALIIVILLIEVGIFWLSVRIMSGIRIYVQAEALYSKGQKIAYNNLLKYAIDFDEKHYQDFLYYLRTPLNAEEFRLAVSSHPINRQRALQALINGGYPVADLSDQIFIYKYFHNLSYMADAVKIWTQADVETMELLAIGERVHTFVGTPYDSANPEEQLIRNQQLAELMQEADLKDKQLTATESAFTAVLGVASRAVAFLLIVAAISLSMVLGLITIFIAVIMQRISNRVEKEKGDFMRIANHQLNTPISIMKNAYAMVEDGSLEMQKGFEYMGGGLTRVVNVFNDIKTVLEFDGQVHYDFQKNDIVPIVNQATAYAKKTAATAKKDVTVQIQPPTFTLPNVICDPAQLNNALYNLLDNAVQYTPKGTVTISYQLVDKKFLKVNIQDTGIGFSPEDKEKLGQKFYRSKKALLARPDGSGLGLYICKNIIQAHGGQLFFDSPGEGKGATFGFTLPVAKG